jgi:hypothetical protein
MGLARGHEPQIAHGSLSSADAIAGGDLLPAASHSRQSWLFHTRRGYQIGWPMLAPSHLTLGQWVRNENLVRSFLAPLRCRSMSPTILR